MPGRLALPNRTASSTTTTTRLANNRPPTPYLATPTLPPLKVLTYLPLSATALRASSLVSISRLSLTEIFHRSDPFHSSSGTSFGLHTALELRRAVWFALPLDICLPSISIYPPCAHLLVVCHRPRHCCPRLSYVTLFLPCDAPCCTTLLHLSSQAADIYLLANLGYHHVSV